MLRAARILQFQALPGEEPVGVGLVDGGVERAVERLGVEAVLHQVVLHARLHGFHGHDLAAGAGEHDQGITQRAAQLPQRLEKFDPVAIGQVEVEENAIRLLGPAGFQPLVDGIPFDEDVLLGHVARQVAPPGFPVFGAVIHDENPAHGQSHGVSGG